MLGSPAFPLVDGYHDLPPGKLANVVTCLEMTRRAPPRAVPPTPGLHVEREAAIDPERYLALFRRIGADYLWFSRLQFDATSLARATRDPNVELWIVGRGDRSEGDLGLVELDFRTANACELLYFGFARELRGTTVARTLMNFALERAWARPIARFWVHTCSLDDPRAVPFYIRSGFVPYKRKIEIHDDPRIAGLLPRDAAPDIPLIEANELTDRSRR